MVKWLALWWSAMCGILDGKSCPSCHQQMNSWRGVPFWVGEWGLVASFVLSLKHFGPAGGKPRAFRLVPWQALFLAHL